MCHLTQLPSTRLPICLLCRCPLQNVAQPPTVRLLKNQRVNCAELLSVLQSKFVTFVCKLTDFSFCSSHRHPYWAFGPGPHKLPGPKPKMKIFGGVTAINVE